MMFLSRPRLSKLIVLCLFSSPYVRAIPTSQIEEPTVPPLGIIKLPLPTGPHTVGTTNLIITDPTRLETLSPSPNTTARTILAQIYYPTYPTHKLNNKYSLSPYFTPGLARHAEITYGLPPFSSDGIITNSYLNAPVSLPCGKPADVVIFSAGHGNSRSFYTTYHEQLASLGYVVIAMEHLYDVTYVDVPGLGEFWNAFTNTTVGIEVEVAALHSVRVGDALFVLSSLADKGSGLVKGVEKLRGVCKNESRGCWWSKDARVAMYGHSLGGSTSAGAMMVNKTPTKILGGINLDGTFRGPADLAINPSNKKIKEPFLLFGHPGHNRTSDDTWSVFYNQVAKGWKRELTLFGSVHGTFTDFPAIVDLFGVRAALPGAEEVVGTIGGERAVEVIREFVAGFVGWVVRGDLNGKRLVEGKMKQKWPEVQLL